MIIAELGLDMGQFPTAAHASAWAKLSPQTIQSGARTRAGKTGKGNRWLRGALGDAAMAAGKTDTYLGERYRRIRRRRGKQKAIVATARAILEIAYLLISNPDLRYHDLGAGDYDRLDPHRQTRNKIRELERLNPGMKVTLPLQPDQAGTATHAAPQSGVARTHPVTHRLSHAPGHQPLPRAAACQVTGVISG